MAAYHCQECGALCSEAAEYHPYLYCELIKLGHRDPAAYLAAYGFERVPEKASSSARR